MRLMLSVPNFAASLITEISLMVSVDVKQRVYLQCLTHLSHHPASPFELVRVNKETCYTSRPVVIRSDGL